MTTIAYRQGILVSDSRLTIDDFITSDKCKKIFRLHDGSLFGWAGDDEGGKLLLQALLKGRQFPKKGIPDKHDDVVGVRILPKGQIYTTEGCVWSRWSEAFIAIGSGSKYAHAAMLAGATAQEAVKIAIKSDTHSGGRVQVLRLKR